jgi:integrase
MVKLADGTKRRAYGVPGTPGDYQEFANTKVGAVAAEQRARELANRPRPAPEPTKVVLKTIRQHAATFLDNYKPGQKPSAKREKRRILNTHLLPVFGHKTIEDLKQTDLDSFALSELARGVVVKTVNEYLTVLSTLIKYVTGSKSKLSFHLDGMDGELHAVDPADVEKLLEACNDPRYRVVVLLAAEAGLRAGEIRGLQWTDVKDEQITVRRALDRATNESVAPKHNKRRSVPMSPRLAVALAGLARRGLWVVAESDAECVKYEHMKDAVNSIYAAAEVARPPKPLHCLRHTFGTVMARRVPLPVLQQLMGHADVQTTLRYVDVNEDDKRAAIAVVFGSSAEPAVAATWQQESERGGTGG